MADITLTNRVIYNDTYIGGVICRTPKSKNVIKYPNENPQYDETISDKSCVLIHNTDELVNQFGNPYIDPASYTDLCIAYNLVQSGIPMWISSVYEMKSNDDRFNIPYNGYTEFTFKDDNGNDSTTYRLKSNIKFCQPIIQSEYNGSNKLDLYIALYYLKRSVIKTKETHDAFDTSMLSDNIHLVIDPAKVDDNILINTFAKHGLELQIIYNDESIDNSKTLLNEFLRFSQLNIQFERYSKVRQQDGTYIESSIVHPFYTYTLNTDNYAYDFDDTLVILERYKSAIELLKHKPYEPHYLLLSKLYKSYNTYGYLTDADKQEDIKCLLSSTMIDLEPESYLIVQTYLMETFDSSSNTYLFISAPDISISSMINLVSRKDNYKSVYELPESYNCDLLYGYASDFLGNDRVLSFTDKVYYSAASLVFYSLLFQGSTYSSETLNSLNVSSRSIKNAITERSAKALLDNRCNSLVLFDKSAPSIYGDRSLSSLPNLQYSHIARTFIMIRRLIIEYLETKKFSLYTVYNVKTYIDYIRTDILDQFVNSAILCDYTIDFNLDRALEKTVYINIELLFNHTIESIELNFTI